MAPVLREPEEVGATAALSDGARSWAVSVADSLEPSTGAVTTAANGELEEADVKLDESVGDEGDTET
jgi:hypothetical protein